MAKRDYLNLAKEECQRYNAKLKLENATNHMKLVITLNDKSMFVIVGRNQSDYRQQLNVRARVRRAIRQLNG